MSLLLWSTYYEGWNPTGHLDNGHHIAVFPAPIRAHCHKDPRINAEEVAWAVFKVLAHFISVGEIQDIQHSFPKELNELWPASTRLGG